MEGQGDLNDSNEPTPSFKSRPQIGLASVEKAGLENVDKEKANKIIYEISKDSKYYKNEQKKSARVEGQIKELLVKLRRIEQEDNSIYEKAVNAQVAVLEAKRDLTQTFFHVDMDAFYASVEIRDNPELKGKPVAVGGSWMLSTASYEARKFGVRSAMPGFIAKQLCPSLIIVPTNFDKYRAASEQTRQIFAMYDPNYRSASLDEASLHVTPYLEKHPDISAIDLAKRIRKDVFNKTRLTCSIGIAPNRRLAKICSDMNKPNGQYFLPHTRETVVSFLKDLPVRKISGIGKVTERLLDAIGVKTCGDMYDKRVIISRLFKSDSAEFFISTALGISNSTRDQLVTKSVRKSISKERTFKENAELLFFLSTCKELSESLAKSMEKKSLAARNLTLKLKTHTFEIKNRSVSLPRYVSSADDIYNATVSLLKKEIPIRLRLIGIRLSKLQDLASFRSSSNNNDEEKQQEEKEEEEEGEEKHQVPISRFFTQPKQQQQPQQPQPQLQQTQQLCTGNTIEGTPASAAVDNWDDIDWDQIEAVIYEEQQHNTTTTTTTTTRVENDGMDGMYSTTTTVGHKRSQSHGNATITTTTTTNTTPPPKKVKTTHHNTTPSPTPRNNTTKRGGGRSKSLGGSPMKGQTLLTAFFPQQQQRK